MFYECYECMECNSLVDEQYVIDGGTELGYHHLICPTCDSEDSLTQAEECPVCGGAMHIRDKLCKGCDAIIRGHLDDLQQKLECSYEEMLDGIETFF